MDTKTIIRQELILRSVTVISKWYKLIQQGMHHYFEAHALDSAFPCLSRLFEFVLTGRSSTGQPKPPALHELLVHGDLARFTDVDEVLIFYLYFSQLMYILTNGDTKDQLTSEMKISNFLT